MAPLSLPGQHPGTGGGALPLVDVAGMVNRIGAAAMSRAHAYAREGRVENLAWHPDITEMTAEVFGTAAEPYEVGVYLKPQQATFRYAGGWCTCPIAADCKHVAAVVLAANTQRLRAEASQKSAVRAAEPAWKGELRRIINPAGERHLQGRSGRLGLQFELRDLETRLGGRLARSGGRRRDEHRLGMRPVEYNPTTGRWLRSDLSWSRFGRPDHVGDFYTPHFELLRELQALRLGTGSGYWNGNDPWLYLDEFTSPLLWTLLGAAGPLGLELVAARRGTGVTLADGTAVVGLEALPGEDDPAALRLVPTLAVEGVALPTERAGTVGDHGTYAVVRTGADEELIILAQSESRLGERERALLGTPEGVEIPAADREAFLAEFYPDLARSVTITADDAVDLPPIEPPLLVLTASFGPRDELRLAWHWEYPAGDVVRQLPLAPVPGEGFHRDEPAEELTLQRVAEVLADSPLQGAPIGPARLEDLDTADFAERALPALERLEGVAVRIEGTKPDYRRLEGAPQLVLSAVESEKNDWFDLGLMVKVEGRTIPFQDIFTALARGRDRVLMPDKTWFRIDTPEIRRLKRIIDESHELREWRIEGPPAKRPPRLSVYQAGLWDEIAELARETVEPARWRQTVDGLLDPHALDPVPVPEGLRATLRPYQDEGFQWLAFLHRHGLGGVLADDMGLGKTLQTLALILHARSTTDPDPAAKPPFLVLAPTSVVPNWEAEAGRFAPGLRTVALTDTQGKSGTPVAASAHGADIVVTSYALFRLDFEAYAALDWSGLIMDEAQFLKNRATKAHQCARDLETPFKLALTGTPLENNLMELWALFAIVSPGLFPAANHFAQDFARPIEKGGDAERLARLRRRVRPLMLRRTKEAVATELPEKLEQRLEVELSPKHRSLYQQYLQREREKVLGLVEDLDRNRFIVFRSLTLLRLMALDPALVDDSHEGVTPAKLDALLEQLDDVVAEGHRALVFSQFTSFLKKAAERLDAAGIAYEYLDGSTRRRGEVVSRFKEGEAPVFLISLKAGGFGLNLTEADYCFLLDPWWNPAAEAQAVDRAHRIGQSRRVMTYRLVAKGTIEEKVMQLKEKKAALFSSVMDDDAMFSSSLTAEDVRGLLA